jgi:hypothetical protein
VWDDLQKENAGKSTMRQSALLQQLATLRPQSEQLDAFVTRVLSLRQQMESACCLHDAVLSCLFLTGLRETDLLGAWAVQQLQMFPVPTMPTLAQSLRTIFLPNLEEVVDSPAPSANRLDHKSSSHNARFCKHCEKPGHSILSCFALRDDIRVCQETAVVRWHVAMAEAGAEVVGTSKQIVQKRTMLVLIMPVLFLCATVKISARLILQHTARLLFQKMPMSQAVKLMFFL